MPRVMPTVALPEPNEPSQRTSQAPKTDPWEEGTHATGRHKRSVKFRGKPRRQSHLLVYNMKGPGKVMNPLEALTGELLAREGPHYPTAISKELQ